MTINQSHDNINVMEEDIIMKKWFPVKPLLDEFLKEDTKEGRCAFINRLDIDHSRLISLQKPGQMISAAYADKYAIKLRISPLPDME